MADLALTTPAPLPSLASAFSRRAALFGAVAATGLIEAAAPASASLDPIIRLHNEWLEHRATYSDPGITEEAAEIVYDRQVAVERRVVQTRALTVGGAIRSLEWVEAEFRAHHHEGLPGDDLILALVDGALGVLRRQEA